MNTNGLLLDYIKKTYPEVEWLQQNKETGIYNFNSTPNEMNIRGMIADFNADINGVKTQAITNFQIAANVAVGEDTRTRKIKDIKSGVIIKLMQDQATYLAKLAEVKGYLKGGRDEIEDFRDFDDVQPLIDYTSNATTHSNYPVLLDDYDGVNKIWEYIVGELS